MAKSPQELTRLLNRCSTFLAEHDDASPDPREPVEIASVRLAIAHTLSELGRPQESLVAANALVDYCLDHHDGEVAERLLGPALIYQARALATLNRLDEAAAVSAEIIVRFRDSGEATQRATLAWALSSYSRLLMRRRETFAQGLAVSDELVELLMREPDDTALDIAEIVIQHIRALLTHSTPRAEAAVVIAAQVLLANTAMAWRSVARRLPARLGPSIARAEALGGRLTPAALVDLAARTEQGMKAQRAILLRLAELDDPGAGPLRARAELLGASCMSVLGDSVGAIRAVQAMNERRDPDVAAAYDATLADTVDLSSRFGKLHAAALLNQRAEALIGDDPALARIAFEDSLARILPESTPRALRWLLLQLRPRG